MPTTFHPYCPPFRAVDVRNYQQLRPTNRPALLPKPSRPLTDKQAIAAAGMVESFVHHNRELPVDELIPMWRGLRTLDACTRR